MRPEQLAREAGLAPHRVRRSKLTNDPASAEKPGDVVGLFVDAPRHAIVLSLDEKSQVQAPAPPGAAWLTEP